MIMATSAKAITKSPTTKRTDQRPARKALGIHHKSIRQAHLRQLFADDPKRGERFTAEAVGLLLDYLKSRITDETLKLLTPLAEESGLRQRIDGTFRRGHAFFFF
jgi:glucose-6-phosphate isomerase